MEFKNLFIPTNKPIAIIVLGLPGSGKSTLIKYLSSNPFKEYKIYDSWSQCTLNNIDPDDFKSECRWKELAHNITQGKDVIISGYKLTDPKYLMSCLQSLYDYEVEVEILYLENNPEKCINNIKVRDSRQGGRFKNNVYFGRVFNGHPDFVEKIKNTKIYSKRYICPSSSSIKIKKIIENIDEKYNDYG